MAAAGQKYRGAYDKPAMNAGSREGSFAIIGTAVPIAVMLVAIGVEPLRLPGLLVLAAGFAVGTAVDRRRPVSPITVVWGAAMLIVLTGVWSGVPVPENARDGTTCADWLAPFALFRAAGAALILAAVAVVLRRSRWSLHDIGVRRASIRNVGASVGLLVVVGLAAGLVGPALAEPYFGPLPVDLGNVSAIVPALIFAIANGVLEETVYRGVLLETLRRLRGTPFALVVQAVAFGLAHGVGSDFAGSPLPVMLATAAGGLGLGLIAIRSGSLLLPIALHVALDIPIYYANACLAP
jgi:membrane protease YdiL (CAAX protease family)